MPEANVAYDPASVSQVRHRLRADLTAAGLPEDLVEDALLVVSEIMGNALRHAAPVGGRHLGVSWDVVGHLGSQAAVRLAVTDGARTETLVPLAADVAAQSGRGLGIVDSLAADWGVRQSPAGKTVWAELQADLRSRALPAW